MGSGKNDINRGSKKYQQNAYFTVEATLVLVIVLGVVFGMVGMLFLQYNRCLLEQDLCKCLIRGSIVWEEGMGAAKEKLENIIKEKEENGFYSLVGWRDGNGN